MSDLIYRDELKKTIKALVSGEVQQLLRIIDGQPKVDAKIEQHGHWVLKAKHYFGDFGECEVYVVASCSECEKKWHNNETVFGKTLLDYDSDDMPDPITDKRIKECKGYCLQEAEKYLLAESPFCEKCGVKMGRKEEDEEIKNV